MVFNFKRYFLLVIWLLPTIWLHGQVSINLSIKPPFTPFISDYTNPARLQDISVALFNQSGNKLRLKFKLALKNQAKGIDISIKENVNPNNPLELDANEFKFLVLEDVSNLYGKLNQNSFNIVGADIQNLILDGTIPDGIYEVCLQAFDFDAPGFTKPLSDNSPSGCFSFQVNYTDPPTDIRFNNNLLQYSFGSAVPKIGVNGVMGQNYNIQFTAPAINLGSSYEYELMIFEENVINPSQQRENSLIEAISTLTPIIRKTSVIPFFSIDPGDIELDFGKNYFMLIKAVDLNEKTLFKNKGFSTFKAFHMIDVQPLIISAPEFTNPEPGKIVSGLDKLGVFSWTHDIGASIQNDIRKNVETRIKIIRLHQSVIIPTDIFNSNIGEVLMDKKFGYDTINRNGFVSAINVDSAFGDFNANSNTRWVIAVKHSIIPGRPFTSHIQFLNNGRAQTDVEFQNDLQTAPAANYLLTQTYPMADDTLPFHYPPVVFKLQNLSANDKVLFTQFNSLLEPVESYKHMKLTTDAVVNSELNGIQADTILSNVSRLVNKAAQIQLNPGVESSDPDGSAELAQAGDILNNGQSLFRVQILSAINSRSIPLGNSAIGKMALLNNVLKYHSAAQFLNSNPVLDFPNMGGLLYLKPFKNNILWTGKIGLYNTDARASLNILNYADHFHGNSFSSDQLKMPMLKNGLKTGSGKFNTGMRSPLLIGTRTAAVSDSSARFVLSFVPSTKPQKLLPEFDNGDAWREFEVMSVAQQWNIEISRNKEFTLLDTVISHRIIKQYNIKQGEAPIVRDLYTKVDQNIVVSDTGKYYWRVTWSNVTLDDRASAAKKAYFTQLGNLLAAAQLSDADLIDFDSLFVIRKNYKVSVTDSFVFNKKTKPSAAQTPAFEVVYPVQGDTIPFCYPPVVIRKNPADSVYVYALSEFNSTLEPFRQLDYFAIKKDNNPQLSDLFPLTRLQSLQHYSSKLSTNSFFEACASIPPFQGESINPTNAGTLFGGYEQLTLKRNNQNYETLLQGGLIPLGGHPKGKINYTDHIIKASPKKLVLTAENISAEKLSISGFTYVKPVKTVSWKARFALFYPNGENPVLLDTFESHFFQNKLTVNSNINIENKLGLSNLEGQFTVGMKTPEIVDRMNGRSIPANMLEISFRPSKPPIKILPSGDQASAWNEWQKLFIAQQWNIEVSKDKNFTNVIYVKSNCLMDEYALNEGEGRIINDFYSIRKEKLSLTPGSKYFYRITWSNPTNLDSGNTLHLNYFNHQKNLLKHGIDTLAMLTGINSLPRNNYSFSAVDSFFLADSASKTDTAICGLACRFDMAGVSTTSVLGVVKIGDVISVGKFAMKVKTVTENVAAKTISGKGSIACSLFAGPIAVTFANIQVNAQKRMITGKVEAEYKTDDFLTNLKGTTTGNSLFDKIRNKVLAKGREINNTVVNEVADTLMDEFTGRLAAADQLNEVYDYFNSPLNLAFDALSGQEVTLPFGLSREVDNYPHTIAITDISFTPSEATFNAAALLLVDLPNFRNYMGFGGSGLCLTPKGIGNVANGGSLELMGSVKIPMGEGYGFFTIMGRDLDTSGRFGNSGTRVMWDCSGFKGIELKVAADISRVVAIPVIGKKRVEKRRLRALGHGMASSGNNWMLSLDFDTTYELTMMPGFTLSNRIVALDFSDIANPQGMEFPAEYQGDRTNTWRGLYIKEVGVGLPSFFKEKDTLSNLSFTARNVILDKTGFTGNFSADNILSINDGTLGGWKYSLDNFGFTFVNSVATVAGFRGKIRVPIFDGELNYSALLSVQRPDYKKNKGDSLGVNFALSNISQLTFGAWFANLNLAPSSKIEIIGNALNPKTLRIRSNFNGDISFGADAIAGLKDIRFGTLPFEGLKFQTAFFTLDSFMLKLDKLGGMDMNRLISETPPPSGTPASTPAPLPTVSGEQKAAGFNISIADFALNTLYGRPCVFDLQPTYTLPRFGIKFKVVVNVADAMGSAIGGSCGMGLYMGLKPENGGLKVIPLGIDVDTIKIEAKLTGAASIKGAIAFIANDPVFGNGIAGMVVATNPLFSAGVTGMFGEINRMRYWMFGLKATFPPFPIDFSANVIYANAVSGEFWYKMNRTPGNAADAAAGFQLGKSPSGASFVPDARQLFGFGLALGITGPPGSPLFGDLGLYAQINNQGGLSKLTLEGNMWMTNNDKATAPLLINGHATIDVDRKRIEGKMGALVNAGGGAVRGRGLDTIENKIYYLAGTVDMLIDFQQNNWHIKLGNPFVASSKLGLGFYAGSTLLFESGGYFMMGNNLPQQLPPMDAGLVSKLQQAGIIVPSSRGATGSTGFVVLGGVDAKIPEKKIELGYFYAGLSVQFAMDGMLKPQGVICPNRNGLSGWYMTGRAYAAVNGALGLHVNTPFFQGDIIAAELNAGMLLDAGLMNPYYFKGQFAANYSVLGGVLEGNKTFNFELQEDPNCKPPIQSRSTSFGNIIADIKPVNNATNVLVGVEPVIALNFPYNKETVLRGTKIENGKTVSINEKIRVKYEYIRLRDDGNLKNRRINIIPSSDGLDLAIRPDSFLRDGTTSHTLSARFFVERFNKNTNAWEPAKRTNGRAWDSVFTVKFKTEAVASFQTDYVSYSTPLAGERYFKPGDFTTAKIVCNRTDIQTAFFTGTLVASGSLREVQLINGYNVYYGQYARAGNPNDTVRVPLTFYRHEIHFPLPQRLDTNSLYQFRIIQERIPGRGLANISGNSFVQNGEVGVRTRTAGNVADRRLIMYSFVFKASKYSRMQDKINQLSLNTTSYLFPTTADIKVIAQTNEPFEDYELKSTNYIISTGNFTLQPSMVLSCSNNAIDDNTWMTSYYRPKVFKAGDTLQRKRTTFTTPFYDITRQLAGANILFDEHVYKSIANSSLAFSFDLRLADNRILQLNEQLIQSKNLYLSGQDGSLINLSMDNGLRLDPVSGMVTTNNQITPNPYTVVQTTTTAVAKPPVGSRLHITYSHFNLISSDFNRLKNLSSRIVSSNSRWYMDLTPKERDLVVRVNNANYTLKLPTASNKFAIALHPKSNNNAPIKKLLLNSNVLDPIAIPTTKTYVYNRF